MHFRLLTKIDLPSQLPGKHAYSSRQSTKKINLNFALIIKITF